MILSYPLYCLILIHFPELLSNQAGDGHYWIWPGQLVQFSQKVLRIGHHGSDRLWFMLAAVVESYTSNGISDFFFFCLRFSTLAKMVRRSQCLLFTRKELNWMVLILPSCTDMEASTYQSHQATGKQGNLYFLLKYLVLTSVTDWGQGGLWIWQSNAFQVPEKEDGDHKDCTSVSRHRLSALLVLNSGVLPRVTEEIYVRAEKCCALLSFTAGTLPFGLHLNLFLLCHWPQQKSIRTYIKQVFEPFAELIT